MVGRFHHVNSTHRLTSPVRGRTLARVSAPATRLLPAAAPVDAQAVFDADDPVAAQVVDAQLHAVAYAVVHERARSESAIAQVAGVSRDRLRALVMHPRWHEVYARVRDERLADLPRLAADAGAAHETRETALATRAQMLAAHVIDDLEARVLRCADCGCDSPAHDRCVCPGLAHKHVGSAKPAHMRVAQALLATTYDRSPRGRARGTLHLHAHFTPTAEQARAMMDAEAEAGLTMSDVMGAARDGATAK